MNPQPNRLRCCLPLLLFAAGCADGGKEDRPESKVKVAASHHMFGFRSLPGFGTFPVVPDVVFTDRGTLNFFEDSSYTIARTNGTSAADSYALADDGALSLYVTGSGREPSVVFKGAYSLAGGLTVPPSLCFTDRVSTPNSQSIGLYVATKVVPGQVELAGAWHVGSLHTIFNEAILSPDNVGRAARGAVSIAAGDPGTERTISGTGQQGTAVVTFGGTIRNLLLNNNGDGTCNLTLSYQVTGLAPDSRVCYAASSGDVVLGLDADETDGEAGLVVMLRKFDAPATQLIPQLVPGRFLIGGHTVFVNPSNPGSDAFVGVVTLSTQGGFRLDAVGNQGSDFAYTGSYTTNQDGGLTLTISGTNETWFAALSRDYQTLLVVDDFREVRSNNQPELNLVFGVREKTP